MREEILFLSWCDEDWPKAKCEGRKVSTLLSWKACWVERCRFTH